MEASEVPLLEARVLILSSSVLDAPLPIMDGLAGLRRAARLTEVTGFVVAIIVKKTAGGGSHADPLCELCARRRPRASS